MAEFSRFLLVVSLAVIGVTACSDDSAEIAEVSFASSSDDNRYTSELFGVSVVKPDGWYASEVELADQLMETGRDFIAGDDDNLRALLDASTQNTFNIFGFYNYEVGAPVAVDVGEVHAAGVEGVDHVAGHEEARLEGVHARPNRHGTGRLQTQHHPATRQLG